MDRGSIYTCIHMLATHKKSFFYILCKRYTRGPLSNNIVSIKVERKQKKIGKDAIKYQTIKLN